MRHKCSLLPASCAGPSRSLFSSSSKQTKANLKQDAAAAAEFFTKHHLRQLIPSLRLSTHCHPRINIVWSTLMTLLVPGYSSQGAKKNTASVPLEQLEAFWGVLVEEDIFQSTSHERKFLGLSLFDQLLSCLDVECIVPLLTPNFLRSVASNASKQGSYLHSAAQRCMDSIAELVKSEDAGARADIFVAVNRHGGNVYTKLLNRSRIGLESSEDTVELVSKLIKEFEDADGDDSHSRQKWVLGQLAAVTRQKQGTAVAEKILKFLLGKGFFKVKLKVL